MAETWTDYVHGAGQPYPEVIAHRYELRHGKFGPYFHDLRSGYDMPLQEVLNTMNRYALRKAQLAWFVGEFGDPTADSN